MKPRLVRNTPEEEAAIQAGIAADPDSPEWTDPDFAHATSAAEAISAATLDMLRRHRGPQRAPVKRPVAIRLDQDVVAALRAGGRGWQGRANALLRKSLGL